MDNHLKIGDLVVTVGRRYSTGSNTRSDVGIIIDIQDGRAKVYWQRSRLKAEIEKHWLMRVSDFSDGAPESE